MERIFNQIKQERARQDAKWGVQNHHPIVWCAILGEQVGEVNREILESDLELEKGLDNLRKELVQVAAVSVAMIECLDKKISDLKGHDSRQLVIEFPE